MAPTKEETEDAGSSSKKRTAITMEGEMPQKKFYRQRAHCNPLSHNDSYEYPRTPDQMDWSEYYPEGGVPTVLDIGCGFGGLTVALGPLLPDEVILVSTYHTIIRCILLVIQEEEKGKMTILSNNSFLLGYGNQGKGY